MKRKVSFDFDSTLTKPSIQEFAHSLVEKGFEVWIITSRCFSGYGVVYDNSDLFEVADRIGIDKNNIIFTQAQFKSDHISNDFIFHIDDDEYELDKIKHIPVVNANEKFCIKKCIEIIQEKIK